MSQTFVQVPPQSTGKKVATVSLTELPFDNITGSFRIGDIVTGENSGATGVVTGVDVRSTTGTLYLSGVTTPFVNNEVLSVSTVGQASANIGANTPQVDFDIQKVAIADPDNPEYVQKIDRFGATVNTFTDGSPIFGSFGTLTVGQPHINRVYRFATGLETQAWYTQTLGGATNTWEGDKTASLMTCTNASGDKVARTTNFYHPYIPGIGINVECTIQIGDSGKENCRRRWGFFDDNDGFYFELDGTDFYVVKRSSTTGTPVETKVIQSDFNSDRADGSDSIGLNLDLTKGNMFWIDIQWYGSGRVRYGMYEPGGTRLTLHEFEHANESTEYPFTRTATLPMRFEQENTGPTSGTSQMRNTGTLIKNAYKADITGAKRSKNSGVKTVTTAGGEVPIFALRPKQTFNGYPNRSILKGVATTLTNITNTGGGPVLYRVRGCFDSALTGETFTSVDALSTTEYDIAADAVNTALTTEVASFIVSGGNTEFIQDLLTDPFLPSFEAVLGADGTTQPVILVTAECLAGTSADVVVAVNWQEIKY